MESYTGDAKWKKQAVKEGRVCPECGEPQSKTAWAEMNKWTPVRHCIGCRYAHWEVPVGRGGSVMIDNEGRDGFSRIR